jgi:hypothetical protein
MKSDVDTSPDAFHQVRRKHRAQKRCESNNDGGGGCGGVEEDDLELKDGDDNDVNLLIDDDHMFEQAAM